MQTYTIKFKCLNKKLIAEIDADSSCEAEEFLYKRIELIGLSFKVCGTQISITRLSDCRYKAEERLVSLIDIISIEPQDDNDKALDNLKNIFGFKDFS